MGDMTSLFYVCKAIIWVMIAGAGVRKHESTKKITLLSDSAVNLS